jgi:hypothetical protein
MKFVSKQLAMILKEKGFDKPCFGWYYIKTPTGMTDGELVLNQSESYSLGNYFIVKVWDDQDYLYLSKVL